MGCKALDSQVAVPTDPKLRQLLEQFVCVRSVQMWALNLDKFQFDGFLTWTVFFLNSDGTIYGRYGSRSESGHDAASDKLISIEGFKKTLQRALDVHRDYRTNPVEVGKQLAGKTGPKRIWKKAEDIPEMEEMFQTRTRYKDKSSRHCIHCHMVPRAEVAALHRLGKSIPDEMFWHFPLPQEIGIELDPKEVATISSIRALPIADNSELRVGDRIRNINGQPILSMADVQWILNHAKNRDTLRLDIERDGKPMQVKVLLRTGWRLQIGDWRYLSQLMQGYLVNFRAQPATEPTRKKLGLEPDALAFKVSWANQWNNKPASPLKNGDVIIAINGVRKSLTVGALTAYLFRDASGKTLHLTVLREGQTRQLSIDVP